MEGKEYDPYGQQQQQYSAAPQMGYQQPPGVQGLPPSEFSPQFAPASGAYYSGVSQQPNMVFVFAERTAGGEDMIWLFPLVMMFMGFLFLILFPPLSLLFWAIGAVFLFYPGSAAKLMGVMNCIPMLCCLLLVALSCCFCMIWIIVAAAGAGSTSSASNSTH